MTVKDLLSASAVRRAAQRMLQGAEASRLLHWDIDLSRLPAVAERVASVTRANYPDLNVPFHARWRHFEAGGRDRWKSIASWQDKQTKARGAFDLAIVSVLLDAGSGGRWSYREPASGEQFRASEGLAVASFDLVANGALSARSGEPWRADAERLAGFTAADLTHAFQVSSENPLAGSEGRVKLLNNLGSVCAARPDIFAIADSPRPGGLVHAIVARSSNGEIAAPAILELVLEALGPIWPSRLEIDGVPLGDAWLYPPWQPVAESMADAVVPFHKLSQWLAYSLIEPLQELGLEVTGIGGLTGLAEYRNGGFFVDGGAIRLKEPAGAERIHDVASPLVVEWRALTVALLDLLHPLVAERLGTTVERFPLACLLQGGTWSAGRLLAQEKRAGGGPPILIRSDGTTF